MKTALTFVLFINASLFAKELAPYSLPIYKEDKTYNYKAPYPKKVLINFWASWCTSCIQEIPILEKLKKDHPEVEFIAVNAGDTPIKIKKFLKKTGFSYKVLMDKDKAFSKGLDILSLPQTLVVNKKGEIIYHKTVPPETL